ncbi:lipase/esterase [Thecamonas trahens ATCC 50062]|uniref:Lipase/esterase n=1 Tax=Thecamonas trahens ATCC 50062 TaxID=461836 RepID=A0A0L0D6R4_THETB|nr:lipase/esterase [Thecamonas trahens ATCC 50062]KNC48039.1 lipase/esterase [Thecamonas trahens ATCC 50062]|eukprot:XP_013759054.1 lipase/esterase [Thecamonas trahens ATCC 50062]
MTQSQAQATTRSTVLPFEVVWSGLLGSYRITLRLLLALHGAMLFACSLPGAALAADILPRLLLELAMLPMVAFYACFPAAAASAVRRAYADLDNVPPVLAAATIRALWSGPGASVIIRSLTKLKPRSRGPEVVAVEAQLAAAASDRVLPVLVVAQGDAVEVAAAVAALAAGETVAYRLVIHLHGGGFVAMSPADHADYLKTWARAPGMERTLFISLDYPLAPEAPFPLALNDAFALYAIAASCSTAPISVVGDSAGGNLAAALGLLVAAARGRARGEPEADAALMLELGPTASVLRDYTAFAGELPAIDALVLIYPSLVRARQRAGLMGAALALDPLLPAELNPLIHTAYVPTTLRAVSATHPLISPLAAPAWLLASADMASRKYVVCGECDPLLDDS